MSIQIVCIIPSRYESTRFPGKPLADLAGKPMIQHVYERVLKAMSVSFAAVATDDERIFAAVRAFVVPQSHRLDRPATGRGRTALPRRSRRWDCGTTTSS